MLDRLLVPIRNIVLAMLAEKNIDYLATYPAQVKAQYGTAATNDVTLDVQAERSDLHLPQRLPVKFGTPATTADFAAGMRVYVAFEGGVPSAPYICGYDPVVVGAVRTVMYGGTKNAARVADTVNCGTLQVIGASTVGPTAFTLNVNYLDPDGGSHSLFQIAALGTIVPSATTLLIPLTGKIDSNSAHVKIG